MEASHIAMKVLTKLTDTCPATERRYY